MTLSSRLGRNKIVSPEILIRDAETQKIGDAVAERATVLGVKGALTHWSPGSTIAQHGVEHGE